MPEPTDEKYNNVRKIQAAVERATGCTGGWIAPQQDKQRNYIGYGFIVDGKYVFLPKQVVMHDPDDETFIAELATKVLGYAPGSVPHLLKRLEESQRVVAVALERMQKQEQIASFNLVYQQQLLSEIQKLLDDEEDPTS